MTNGLVFNLILKGRSVFTSSGFGQTVRVLCVHPCYASAQ